MAKSIIITGALLPLYLQAVEISAVAPSLLISFSALPPVKDEHVGNQLKFYCTDTAYNAQFTGIVTYGANTYNTDIKCNGAQSGLFIGKVTSTTAPIIVMVMLKITEVLQQP